MEYVRLIFDLLDQIIVIYSYTLIIYALMSWFPNLRGSRLYEFFENVCEPYIRLFRFARVGMISFAIMAGIIGLYILQILLTIIERTIIQMM